MFGVVRLARSRLVNNGYLVIRNVTGGKNLSFHRFLVRNSDGITKQPPQSVVVTQNGDVKEDVEVEYEEELPWYLRDDTSSPLIEKKVLNLPELPQDSPKSLENFVNLLGYDYGMENILLFDLNELDEDHTFSSKNGPLNFILIGTGKSEKHCYKAASELRLYLKHEYGIIPVMEGMVSAGVSPVARRRILRNARKGPLATENTYGKEPNSWIMCDSGIDGIQIHFLTKERRQQLNLEELWCKPQDLYKFRSNESEQLESDDIFIGIRRQFHTMTPFRMNNQLSIKSFSSESNENLHFIFNNFLQEDLNMTEDKLNSYISSFNSGFTHSLTNFQLKFQLFKLIHIMNSNLVSFNDLVDILLQKNSSLMIAVDVGYNLQKEKVQDVIDYMKLLIDSPEINKQLSSDPSERANYLFQRLSNFISEILRFSDVNLLENEEFIALLLRLTFIKSSEFVGPKQIDRYIKEGKIDQVSSEKLIEVSGTRLRDILDLITYNSRSHDQVYTTELKELILFTYGNANDWPKFWKKWNTFYGLLNWESATEQSITKWVRLAVYLAARNNKPAMIYFLNNYWEKSSSVTKSILHDLQENNFKFNLDTERIAFKVAMTKILQALNEDEKFNTYENITNVIENL